MILDKLKYSRFQRSKHIVFFGNSLTSNYGICFKSLL